LVGEQFEAAIEHLERALELNPQLDSARVKLSQALARGGEQEQAEQVMSEFLQRNPFKDALVKAAELQRQGQLEDAENIYRDILRKDSRNIEALRMLALLAMKLEHFKDAETLLRRVVGLAPDYPNGWIELGRSLVERNEFDEGIEMVQRGIELDPTLATAWVTLGNALARASRQQEAIQAYEMAARQRPNQAGIYLGLGNVLKTVGEQDRAVQAYRHGIELRADYGEIYWSLSNLKTFRFQEAEVQAMLAQHADGSLSRDKRVHFCFALGKAMEDRQDYSQAFKFFEEGNRLRREQESYDPVETEYLNDRIVNVFTRDFLESRRDSGNPDPAPIFVVGLPRSGSTLIEQILSSHSQVDATHELPEMGRLIQYMNFNKLGPGTYPESMEQLQPEVLRQLGDRYIELTRKYRGGRAYFIDKMPNNFPTIGLISLVLPKAKIIASFRHPMDTCWSCYKQLFARGQSFTYDLVEIGEYYLQFRRMMRHWHEVLPGKVLDVHYEKMVSDQEGQTRRLLAHCGLDWEDACLRFYETQRAIRTASSEQVRQPIYSSSVGVWNHYGDYLRELSDLVQMDDAGQPPNGE
jgi:tetratricopeptide (TPR) repeat protein